MTLFTERDKIIRQAWVSDSGTVLSELPVSSEDADEFQQVGYEASRSILIDRLNVMGFTLKASRLIFEEGVRSRLDELSDSKVHPEIEAFYAKEIDMYKSLSFENWLRSFREIKGKGATSWDISPHNEEASNPELSDLARFVLSSGDYEPSLRFPVADVRYLLRAVLETGNSESMMLLDLTDVVDAGYYSVDDRVSEMARLELSSDYPTNNKIVVLTEGSTDSRLLESSLELLAPHLSEYYSFMDFHAPSVPGGAGQLMNTIKAFVGAGISNRIVALFDNDTAARAALRALDRIALLKSLRIVLLPKLPLAASYPTIGPSGLVHMDVNGLAGSLELYFGKDVLEQSDGTLTPVHWRGYDPAVGAYQGELTEKAQLQERFGRKLVAATSNPSVVASQDWTAMRSVLDAIRCAFDQ